MRRLSAKDCIDDPALLAGSHCDIDCREFLHAKADRVVGVVEVTPTDRSLLHLGGSRQRG